jgi:hypothetical protein
VKAYKAVCSYKGLGQPPRGSVQKHHVFLVRVLAKRNAEDEGFLDQPGQQRQQVRQTKSSC